MQKSISPSLQLLISLTIVITAALLLYYPALQFEYIWDDLVIRQHYNNYVISHPVIEAFSQSLLNSDYYRPLPVYSMILETQHGGSHLGHAINLSLFVGCGALIVLTCSQLLTRLQLAAASWLPLLAGLLFIVHPATAVGAMWVSVRFDLAMTLFCMLLLLCDLLFKHVGARSMSVGLCFLLASLCKEMAIAIACIMPLWHLFVAGKCWQGMRDYWSWIKNEGHLAVYIAIFIAGCIYLGLRINALGELLSNDPATASSVVGNLWQHLLYVGKTFAWYLMLIFWPFGAIRPAYYESVPISNSDVMALAGVAALVTFILLGTLQQYAGRIGWAMLILVIVLLPVLNIQILPIHDNIVDLRFAYLPAAMAVLLIITALGAVARSSKTYWNRVFIPISLLWIILGALNVHLNLPLWRNDLTFWTWYVKASPQSQIAYSNYSNVLMRYGKYEDAIHYAKLAIHDTHIAAAGPWLNMGISQIYLHDFENGVQSLENALSKAMSVELQTKAKSHIAKARISQEKYAEAEALLNESITLNPDHLHGYGQLARLGWLTKNQALFDDAITNIQRISGNNATMTKSVLLDADVPIETLH